MVERDLLGNKTKVRLLQEAKRRRRQTRNLGARHGDARISAIAKDETTFARHGEEHRGSARAYQGFDVEQRSRGRVSLEDLDATLAYAAKRIPEIADNVVEVDRAMRWGFGWELGPFEVWDAIGVEKSVVANEGRRHGDSRECRTDARVRRHVVLQKR